MVIFWVFNGLIKNLYVFKLSINTFEYFGSIFQLLVLSLSNTEIKDLSTGSYLGIYFVTCVLTYSFLYKNIYIKAKSLKRIYIYINIYTSSSYPYINAL